MQTQLIGEMIVKAQVAKAWPQGNAGGTRLSNVAVIVGELATAGSRRGGSTAFVCGIVVPSAAGAALSLARLVLLLEDGLAQLLDALVQVHVGVLPDLLQEGAV